MAQALFVAPPSFHSHSTIPPSHSTIPPSPDPTPLRLLAFSVAEAALQSNPNSPALNIRPEPSARVGRVDRDWAGPWTQSRGDLRPPFVPKRAVATGGGGSRLWDVVERAKERRVKADAPTASRSPSPPAVDYNFVLPSHSPLASSVAAYQARQVSPARQAAAQTPPPRQTFPMYTRSAEPSPTKNIFTAHDQNRASPEVRLPAREFACKQMPGRVQRRSETHPAPLRHISRLPSLAQIQAKLQRAGHRRSGSTGAYSPPQMPRIERTISNDSMDILQTPRGDSPAVRPRIVGSTDSPDRCPPTPPSPTPLKDDRLSSFLRERTSGRLAEAKSRPVATVAPKAEGVAMSFPGSGPAGGPVYTVTPPTLERRRPSIPCPVVSRPSLVLSTPPSRCSPLGSAASPLSPTDSLTTSSTSSPTLSVPIITCTPAPSRLVRNGVEQDSDEEEGDFVLFEAETDSEEAADREERERRSKEMLDRLMLRRQSD